MAKYYLDTCIWRDYFENRKDDYNNLGDFALEFIKKVNKNKETILYSETVIEELSKAYTDEEIKEILNVIDNKSLLIKVEIDRKDLIEAKKISDANKIPVGDAIHAIAARNNNAIIITRDVDFLKLRNIAKSKKPEELI